MKMEPVKILIVATSHGQIENSNRKTGLWLEELAVPYYIFKEAGAMITLASPKGGEVPLDPKSESIIVSTSTTKRFQKDQEAMFLLENSIPIDTQKAEDFDLVFLLGGHGPMWDFPANEPLKQLLEDFNLQHKFIGAVCHGAAALIPVINKLEEPLMKGRQVTAYSNSEEQVSGMVSSLPFLLESKLIDLGAAYSKGPDFLSNMVIDGNIITGQNSASAKMVARKLLLCFKESPKKVDAVIH